MEKQQTDPEVGLQLVGKETALSNFKAGKDIARDKVQIKNN